MSKTKFVRYADHGFWAYDVAVHIFLKHLIDAAEARGQEDTGWLSGAVSSWRLACVPDLGLTLNTDWTEDERKMFIGLVQEACMRIARRKSIPAEEIAAWPILEDLRIFPRGEKEVLTAPVVELGRAIIALVSGELPEAPKGGLWFYGTPSGRSTIKSSS